MGWCGPGAARRGASHLCGRVACGTPSLEAVGPSQQGCDLTLKPFAPFFARRSRVMLFMKGSPDEPRCGFSRQIVSTALARVLGVGGTTLARVVGGWYRVGWGIGGGWYRARRPFIGLVVPHLLGHWVGGTALARVAAASLRLLAVTPSPCPVALRWPCAGWLRWRSCRRQRRSLGISISSPTTR
jgi:hypothetical protein